jgi:hypothetical protein
MVLLHPLEAAGHECTAGGGEHMALAASGGSAGLLRVDVRGRGRKPDARYRLASRIVAGLAPHSERGV